MKTSYGLEFDTVTEINPEWSDYDKTIAGCHLANARCFFFLSTIILLFPLLFIFVFQTLNYIFL